ncbi:Uncharacterized protein At4g02000 [Linum grandiflorum]
MADLWRPYRGIQIEEVDGQRILFRFFHVLDLRWVIDNGAWTFDSWLVVMTEIKPAEIPTQVPLFEANFWVQGHSMPASYCTEAVGQVIGNHVGSFVGLDKEHKFSRDEPYIRLRARLDVRRPLKKEKKIRRPGGEWVIISLKYEKLPTFCFTCGRMGHVDRGCALRFQAGNQFIPQRWTSELRAMLRRKKSLMKSKYLVEDTRSLDTVMGQTSYQGKGISSGSINQHDRRNDEVMEEIDYGTEVGEDRLKRRHGENGLKETGVASLGEQLARSFGNNITNTGGQDPKNLVLAGLETRTCPSS